MFLDPRMVVERIRRGASVKNGPSRRRRFGWILDVYTVKPFFERTLGHPRQKDRGWRDFGRIFKEKRERFS